MILGIGGEEDQGEMGESLVMDTGLLTVTLKLILIIVALFCEYTKNH